MNTYDFQPGPIHVLRLEEGIDIVDAITGYAAERGIRAAWFTYLGAVSRAALRAGTTLAMVESNKTSASQIT